MGRQYRPPRRGQLNKLVSPQVVTSSSTAIAIPNYGITDVSAWAAGDYVLDSPDEGVRKTILSISSTSVARVIRSATDASVKIGSQGATQLQFGATTLACCVVLIGINSTQWAIETAYPPVSTAGSIVIATS